MRIRKYELYSSYPGDKPTNMSVNYHTGMWVIIVNATSIRQAYALYYSQSFAKERKGLGIIEIDNSLGPIVGWPWNGRAKWGEPWTMGIDKPQNTL